MAASSFSLPTDFSFAPEMSTNELYDAFSKAGSPDLSVADSSTRGSPSVATPPESVHEVSELPPPPAISSIVCVPGRSPTPPALAHIVKASLGTPKPAKLASAPKVPKVTPQWKLEIKPEDYDRSGAGKTACHVCRTRSNRFKMACSTSSCVKRFCAPCMRSRHGHMEEYSAPNFEFVNNGTFLCPFCRGNCQCSVCTERRARVAAGIPPANGRRKRRDSLDGLRAPSEASEGSGTETKPPKKRIRPPKVPKKVHDLSDYEDPQPLPLQWTLPPVPLSLPLPPAVEPVYALNKRHLRLHTGLADEDGYTSTGSSASENTPVNPLAAQRRLVKALGMTEAPPRNPSTFPPRDLAPTLAPAPGHPTGLEREIFDDYLLGPTPCPTGNSMLASPGFPLPIMTHHFYNSSDGIAAWAAFNAAPDTLGAPSYLEP